MNLSCPMDFAVVTKLEIRNEFFWPNQKNTIYLMIIADSENNIS